VVLVVVVLAALLVQAKQEALISLRGQAAQAGEVALTAVALQQAETAPGLMLVALVAQAQVERVVAQARLVEIHLQQAE
jgi:hypothetical protein